MVTNSVLYLLEWFLIFLNIKNSLKNKNSKEGVFVYVRTADSFPVLKSTVEEKIKECRII